MAGDIKGLFETMVDAFREAEPELAREIDREAAAKKGAPVEEPERGGRGRVEAFYDFETLKDITIYGFVSLRVPARWPEARAENGRGGFWEEGVESGTFWIDWDVYALKGRRPRHGDSSAIRVADAGDKAVSYRRTEAVEKGEALVIHNWLVTCGRPGLALMVHFNLVLLADLAERNDFRPLPKLIDREIRAARIDFDRIPRGAE